MPVRIDFISDISCPWCAIGLHSLQRALEAIGPDLAVDLRMQPFELNPHLGKDGQDLIDYLIQTYRNTPEQQAAIDEQIRQRGADVGFMFSVEARDRILNTFDAHRLIYWAAEEGLPGQQKALMKALVAAYHAQGEDTTDHAVLLKAVAAAGLNERRAREVLTGDEFAHGVRERENFYAANGIQAVPSVVVNGRYLVTGGQAPDVFEGLLRQVMAEMATDIA